MTALLKPEVGYSSSGCSSHGSPSYSAQEPSLMHRSVSSHTLPKSVSRLIRLPAEFVDSEASSVRRVFSAGDLPMVDMVHHNQRSESSLSIESSIIESMSRASRYSPEEKRERIERYRSKRSQRNFTKKIKYACRKTLADSRPRVRGRFARTEEMEKSSQSQWRQMGVEEDDEYDDNWVSLLDALSANTMP
ncbi:hypothetical protein NMG60_11033932 [Bertholletia excelsa]